MLGSTPYSMATFYMIHARCMNLDCPNVHEAFVSLEVVSPYREIVTY